MNQIVSPQFENDARIDSSRDDLSTWRRAWIASAAAATMWLREVKVHWHQTKELKLPPMPKGEVLPLRMDSSRKVIYIFQKASKY